MKLFLIVLLVGIKNLKAEQDLTNLTEQPPNWEKIANDLLKKISDKSKGVGSLLPAIQKGKNQWADLIDTTLPPPVPGGTVGSSLNISNNNTSTPLSDYGPWGYLMLGMLICGTVLTFCGLWECCCRKNKTTELPHSSPTPSGISVTSGAIGSTAILVTGSIPPPKYEELDQPPSYSVLFPEKVEV